jgi:hypothetical protein
MSQPLAQGHQIAANVSGLTPGEAVKVHIEGPRGRREFSRVHADPNGEAQVFLHGAQVGTHTIALEAESGRTSTEFEVK